METAETKTVDNQTAAAPQQYTIVPDDSKPIFEDDTKKILIRDGDKKFTQKFDDIFKIHNTRVKKLPYRSPNLNPYAESWVSLIKRECIEKFFIFGESHLEYLVREYTSHYNEQRPHSSLGNIPPEPCGAIKCESRLGGVLKHYWRE